MSRRAAAVAVLLAVFASAAGWLLWPGERWDPVWERADSWPICVTDAGRLVLATWDNPGGTQLHLADAATGRTLSVIEPEDAAFAASPLPGGRVLYAAGGHGRLPLRVRVWDGAASADVVEVLMTKEERFAVGRLVDGAASPDAPPAVVAYAAAAEATESGAALTVQFRVKGGPVRGYVDRTYAVDGGTLEVTRGPDVPVTLNAAYTASHSGHGRLGATRVMEAAGVTPPLAEVQSWGRPRAVRDGRTLVLMDWRPSPVRAGLVAFTASPLTTVAVWRLEDGQPAKKILSKQSDRLFGGARPNHAAVSADGSRLFLALDPTTRGRRSTACFDLP